MQHKHFTSISFWFLTVLCYTHCLSLYNYIWQCQYQQEILHEQPFVKQCYPV